MRVVLCVHGYPPELVGGTELLVRDLAHALARCGDRVTVVAGTLARSEGGVARREEREPVAGAGAVRVVRLARPDLYHDHWQKTRSAAIARAFREVLRAARPDVVHVHHWLRLSRDLVLAAAREGVPAVVSLHDHFTTCPLVFRVDTGTRRPCARVAGPGPCLPCLARVPPRTPWVPPAEQALRLGERAHELARELALARVVTVPGAAHGRAIAAGLAGGTPPAFEVLPPPAAVEPAPRPPLAPPSAQEPLLLGSWGALSEVKGTDLLVEALARTRDPARFELRLAGAEPEPGWLARLQARFSAVRVHHEPAFEREALGELAATNVHLFISGSRAPESHGRVLDEARALGLAAVLPDAGAFAERARAEGAAALYPPGDAAALAALLDALRDDPKRLARLRDEAPAAACGLLSPAAHAARTRALLAEAVRRGAPPPDELPAEEWYAGRMAEFAEAEWDRRLSETAPDAFGPPPDAER